MQSKMKPRWMICKIQVSISGKPGTLIYNEDHSFQHMCDRKFGEECLGDDLKGYFKCRFMNGEFYVHKRISDKDWWGMGNMTLSQIIANMKKYRGRLESEPLTLSESMLCLISYFKQKTF